MATPWCRQVLVWHHCDITLTWHLCVCVYWREAGCLVDQDAVIFRQFNQSVRLSGKSDDDSAPLQILSHTWMTTPPARTHTHTQKHTPVLNWTPVTQWSNMSTVMSENLNEVWWWSRLRRTEGWWENTTCVCVCVCACVRACVRVCYLCMSGSSSVCWLW